MKPSTFVTPLVVLSSLLLGQTVANSQVYQPSGRIPVTDDKLGTQVTGTSNFNITGGMSRGGHLFHSFQDFSVPTNGAANFANPANDRGIITRVTGSLFSDINGTINTQGANFLLINPHGVVFGPGTQLSVGGIFAVSTADSLDLTDGKGGKVIFGTSMAGDASLLNVNPSALFNVSRFNLGGGGEIKNFGTLQTTNSKQYIGLIGGNVSIEGGHIVAPGGRVELGGLSAPGGVDFTGNKVVFPVEVARSDVSLKNSSTVDVRIVDVRSVGGGDITINAGDINLAGASSLLGGVSVVGTSATVAGDIKLDAIGSVKIISGSQILNNVRANSIGNSGKIDISAGSLLVESKALISAGTSGMGNAGSININANSGSITVDGATIGSSIETDGVATAPGAVTIKGASLSLQNGGVVQTVVSSKEDNRLVGLGNAGKGDAGSINVDITGNINISGFRDVNERTRIGSGIYNVIGTEAIGNGGLINVKAGGSLSLENGAAINASVVGTGNAGSIKITTPKQTENRVSLNGSTISSDVLNGAKGQGGDVEIITGSLSARNNSSISAGTSGSGRAGSVTVRAKDAVSLDFANILSDIRSGGNSNKGELGTVNIFAGSLSLRNAAIIQTTTAKTGEGNAGNINIDVTGTVDVAGTNNGEASRIRSSIESGVTGDSGIINIKAGSLNLTDRGVITAGTAGIGSAGVINVSTPNGSIFIDNALIGSSIETLGFVPKGGKVSSINLTGESLKLQNGAVVQTVVSSTEITKEGTKKAGEGNAGNIRIDIAKDVDITGFNDSNKVNRSGIYSVIGSDATGNAGNIDIKAGSLSLQNGSSVTASTGGKGNAGNVTINTTANPGKNTVSLKNSTVSSDLTTGSEGKGGRVNINTGALSLIDSSSVSAGTRGSGSAGNVTVNASDAITLDLSNIVSDIGADGNSNGQKGGGINLSARHLSLRNGATIQTTTFENGKGGAADIDITARESVDVSGAKDNFVSGIFSSVRAGVEGDGGNIKITSNSLSVREQAIISAGTSGAGKAGSVDINSDLISVDGATISSNIETNGKATLPGAINIKGASLFLQNGGVVQTVVSSQEASRPAGNGPAGNIDVDISGNIDISGVRNTNRAIRSGIFSTVGKGVVENTSNVSNTINISAGSLSLRNGAAIAASTAGKDDAGSINIRTTKQAENSVSLDTSTISSDVAAGAEGKGGNILIDTGSLSLSNSSSVSAGTRGIGRAGNVRVNASDAITLDLSNIVSDIGAGGNSNGQAGGGVNLSARSLSLKNGATIQTTTFENGKGDAGDIDITARESVDVSGANGNFASGIFSSIRTGVAGNGGTIKIHADSLVVKDKAIVSAGISGTGKAGVVDINSDSITIDGAVISSNIETGGVATASGAVNIKGASLLLQNGGVIQTLASNRSEVPGNTRTGDAGSVNVDITGDINISGSRNVNGRTLGSGISSETGTGSVGKGGLITVKAGGSLSLESGAEIKASTAGNGNAGDIIITTPKQTGNAVTLNKSFIFSDVLPTATGDGGNIKITTGSLSLSNSSSISAGTSGKGEAGNVTIDAKGAITLNLSNILSDIRSGGLSSIRNDRSNNKKEDDRISILAGSLSLRNAALIQTTTSGTGKGDAGNINIDVKNGTVDVIGVNNGAATSILSSISENAEGAGGAIKINAGSLLVRDGALLEASTAGNGNAGAIDVDTTDSVLISGKNGNSVSRLSVSSTSNQSTVTAGGITVDSPKINLDNNGTIESRSTKGTGGNINIGTDNKVSGNNTFLILRHGSKISTNSSGPIGTSGGNIKIGSNFVVGIPQENSDITANAAQGRGGNVNINSQGVFGIQKQPEQPSSSDITASSEVGLSGSININTPGVDPGKNIGELPAAPTDASKQISQACTTNPIDNKFVVTGRGGHPPNTDGQLTSETYWQDARDSKKASSAVAATPNTPLQPAVGWVFDKQGNVTLLAHNSATESTKLKITCPVSPKTLAGGTQLQ
jgi:filamentous hemagglutinin family protein